MLTHSFLPFKGQQQSFIHLLNPLRRLKVFKVETSGNTDSCRSCRTVRCLAGLSGSTLLNMSREELKVVCPEEGGRVFFQLQAVRSTLAVSETQKFSLLFSQHRESV